MKELIKKILRESVITEGRVEDMKKKYPEHESVIDYFVSNDPSGNNKYLPWMMKQLVTNNDDQGVIASTVKKFHTNQQRLHKKDINQYKTVAEVVEALNKVGKSKGEERRQTRLEGANVVYEDDNVIALRPLNHKASCTYGAGTKWCITSKSTDTYWNGYTKKTSNFAGTNWYESEWVEERIEPNFIQRLLGKEPKVIRKEVKNFINHFPSAIFYFVIYKRRVKEYSWDEDIQARIPVYEKADPKDPLNKLALLYKPERADFGDTSWSEYYREGDYLSMIGDKLDAAHNNLSIFNALDKKVTLREISNALDEEFSIPFRFIEHDFQKERNKILYHVRNVLDKVFPLLGAEGSKRPMSWITNNKGELVAVPNDVLKKGLGKDGGKRVSWASSHGYKKSAW